MTLGSESEKNIHSGHRSRVREKIKKGALETMTDHELLEYLLFHTVAYKDTNELAHRLINYFGSFHGVLDAQIDDLMQVKGVTEVTAVFLSSLKTVFKRYGEDVNRTPKIRDVNDVAKYMEMKYLGETVEKVFMICLDGKMNIIKCEVIGEGTSCEVSIENRKVMEVAIRSNADNVILVHNHPNEIPTPSSDDIESTYLLKKMLKNVGIKLVDSIIVAGDSFVSLARDKRTMDLF